LAYFSLKKRFVSPSLWLPSILIEDDTDGEFAMGGNGGTFELAVEVPFAAAALRLELLFVFARPKPCRLEQ
jgi:hypothetical protein